MTSEASSESSPSSQSQRLEALLHVLHEQGLLENVVIIGRWCVYLYQQSTQTPEALAFRTKDIDVLLPRTLRADANLLVALSAIGFIISTDPLSGHSIYSLPEIDLEFLTPERGAGSQKPVEFKTLGISAQSLRYLDFLLKETVTVVYSGLNVCIPKPEAYLLHKMLVLDRRTPEKRESDITTVQGLMEIVRNSAEKHKNLRVLFDSFPGGWHKTIGKNSKDYFPEFLELLNQPKGNA